MFFCFIIIIIIKIALLLLETEVIPILRELGIGIVAYSPLRRGFLTGSIADIADLSQEDRRR
jgi:aryl-alcohol dehydrogenase-like predicted oxidoreductase